MASVEQSRHGGWRRVGASGWAGTLAMAVLCSTQPLQAQPRIVGGQAALSGAYPWMAALVSPAAVEGNDLFIAQFCGGALIAPNWVVTAAHCVFEARGAIAPDEVRVSVGTYRLSAGQPPIGVSNIYIHPEFDPFSLSDDLALLELANPAAPEPLTGLVTEEYAELTAAGERVVALGWGALSEEGQFPDILQEVELEVVDDWVCALALGRDFAEAGSRLLCAGYPEGGRDTCQGDSGGPVVVGAPGGGHLLAGVTSYGMGCARTFSPGLYTEVQAYSGPGDWLSQCLSGSCSSWDELECSDGRRVSPSVMCDGVEDCVDGEDESYEFCPFFCGPGDPLPWELWCDGRVDCPGGRDESLEQCGRWGCGDGEEISRILVCDGVEDCSSGSDESGELCTGTYTCSAGEEVPLYWVCDATEDCLNGSDEAICQEQLLAVEAGPGQCEEGGVEFLSGIDLDQDGLLESYEVQGSTLLCDGAAGQPIGDPNGNQASPVQLVRVVDVETAEGCAQGGVVVATGKDLDLDGTLDADEVTQTSTLCTDSLRVLVELETIEAGADCEAGGVQIATGLDADEDGRLSAAEVTETEVVCNGDGEQEPEAEPVPNADDAGVPTGRTRGDAGVEARPSTSISSLVRVDELEELEECSHGGVVVRSGVDEDQDGKLELDEQDQRAVICNPAPAVSDGGCGCSVPGRSRSSGEAALWSLLLMTLGGVLWRRNKSLHP